MRRTSISKASAISWPKPRLFSSRVFAPVSVKEAMVILLLVELLNRTSPTTRTMPTNISRISRNTLIINSRNVDTGVTQLIWMPPQQFSCVNRCDGSLGLFSGCDYYGRVRILGLTEKRGSTRLDATAEGMDGREDVACIIGISRAVASKATAALWQVGPSIVAPSVP